MIKNVRSSEELLYRLECFKGSQKSTRKRWSRLTSIALKRRLQITSAEVTTSPSDCVWKMRKARVKTQRTSSERKQVWKNSSTAASVTFKNHFSHLGWTKHTNQLHGTKITGPGTGEKTVVPPPAQITSPFSGCNRLRWALFCNYSLTTRPDHRELYLCRSERRKSR